MKTQIAAIDFGTSKVVTVVAQSGGLSRCDIIGSGTVPYAGYKDGDWNEPDNLIYAVKDSVSAAELESNSKIREIYVGVPGAYVHIVQGEAEIDVPEGGKITEDEVDAVQDKVADKLRVSDMGGYVLHRSPAWFSIDDGKKTMMPIGESGQRLRSSVSFIVADSQFITDVSETMGSLGITVVGFLSPALGQSMHLLSLEDRDRVSALIDVGYLNTEISVIEGDAIIYHAILNIGGGYMTADIAEGLKILMREAEQIKRAFLFNPDEFDQNEYYEAVDEGNMRMTFSRDAVTRIVEKSMDSMCDLIDRTIKNDAARHFGPRTQIYLTGGGIALMRGGREYLAAKIGSPVKVPPTKSAKLNSPIYASSLGLVSLILDSIEQQDSDDMGIGKKILGMFKR